MWLMYCVTTCWRSEMGRQKMPMIHTSFTLLTTLSNRTSFSGEKWKVLLSLLLFVSSTCVASLSTGLYNLILQPQKRRMNMIINLFSFTFNPNLLIHLMVSKRTKKEEKQHAKKEEGFMLVHNRSNLEVTQTLKALSD
jgi:hypothetical protein